MKKIEFILLIFSFFLLLPLIYMLTLGNLAFDGDKFISLSFNTLSLCISATLLSFVFALPSAFIFTCKRAKLIVASMFIVSIIPPFLLSILLSNLFFTLNLANGFVALSFAHMISIYPYTLVLMILGFTFVPINAKKSGKLYASNIFKSFVMFYFPFMKNTFSVAFILGISISMSQYIITLMLSKPSFSTLIVQIIPFLKSADIQSASSYGIVFLINAFVALYLFSRFKNVLPSN